jgi:FkbM family methyltransferase
MKRIGSWYMPTEENTIQADMIGDDYQKQQQTEFLNIILPNYNGGAAVDVGAHIGLWSRRLAECFDHVYAYEPIRELAECYRRNMTKNNYHLREIGLSDRAGTLSILYDATGSQNTHINCSVDHAGTRIIEVETLDQQTLPTVAYIKMDVEGWELPILKGARNIMERDHPFISVEAKNTVLRRYGQNKQDLHQYLESQGYRRLHKVANDVLYGYHG